MVDHLLKDLQLATANITTLEIPGRRRAKNSDEKTANAQFCRVTVTLGLLEVSLTDLS